MGYPLVQTNYYYTNLLTAAINPALAAPVLLAAAKMMLGTAAITPSLTIAFADLVEATFVGYAESATIVWGALLNEVDGSPVSDSPSHLFRATSNAAPNTIQAFGVTDGVAPAATGILASARITPGIPIVNPGDGFTAVCSWSLGPTLTNTQVTIVL